MEGAAQFSRAAGAGRERLLAGGTRSRGGAPGGRWTQRQVDAAVLGVGLPRSSALQTRQLPGRIKWLPAFRCCRLLYGLAVHYLSSPAVSRAAPPPAPLPQVRLRPTASLHASSSALPGDQPPLLSVQPARAPPDCTCCSCSRVRARPGARAGAAHHLAPTARGGSFRQPRRAGGGAEPRAPELPSPV